MRRRISPIVLSTTLFASAPFVAAAEKTPLPEGRDRSFTKQEEERALTIQHEFQDAGRALAETHAEALRRPELQAPLEALRKAMEEEMIRRAPDKKAQILRRYAVHREMQELEKIEHPTKQDKDRYQALLLEFTNLTETLGDLPDQAAKSPALTPAKEKFHRSLLEVMTKIDPKTPQRMQQQKKSVAEYDEFTEQLLKKATAPKPVAPPAAAATPSAGE